MKDIATMDTPIPKTIQWQYFIFEITIIILNKRPPHKKHPVHITIEKIYKFEKCMGFEKLNIQIEIRYESVC